MNPLDRHRDVIANLRETIPGMAPDAQLFQAPWQARIFALIVVMVKGGHFPWTAFQTRLAHAITVMEQDAPDPDPTGVESRYFDCWLVAVEETLADQGFMTDADITDKIQDIRASVAQIRTAQLSQTL